MEVKPEVKPKRKYTHAPEVRSALAFNRRVKKIQRLIRKRSLIAAQAAKAQARLDKFDRVVKRAKHVLVNGI